MTVMVESLTIESFMGGFVIETFLGILLYGISLAQAYVYWLNCTRGPNYNHDPRILRSSVLLVMIIETVHTALLMQATYHHTVITACSPWEDLKVLWSAGVCVLLGVAVTGIVHSFYISRIWILTEGSNILTLVPTMLAFLRAAFGVGTAAFIFIFEVWTDLRLRLAPKVVLESGITLSAATDLTIAGILIYRLRKSRTGFEETDHMIQRIMMYVVHTGAMTTLCSIGVIFLFVFMKRNLAFAGLSFLISKLYANAFLGALNARKVLWKPGTLNSVKFVSKLHPIEIFKESSKITDEDAIEMSSRDVSRRFGLGSG